MRAALLAMLVIGSLVVCVALGADAELQPVHRPGRGGDAPVRLSDPCSGCSQTYKMCITSLTQPIVGRYNPCAWRNRTPGEISWYVDGKPGEWKFPGESCAETIWVIEANEECGE